MSINRINTLFFNLHIVFYFVSKKSPETLIFRGFLDRWIVGLENIVALLKQQYLQGFQAFADKNADKNVLLLPSLDLFDNNLYHFILQAFYEKRSALTHAPFLTI